MHHIRMIQLNFRLKFINKIITVSNLNFKLWSLNAVNSLTKYLSKSLFPTIYITPE
jgi:hypothetical protein